MRSAAAQVARKGLTDFDFARVGVGLKKRYSCHDHAVQAVPALRGLRLDERLLNRMGLAVFGESLESCNRSPIEFDRRDNTRSRGAMIDQYGTGAALTQSAAIPRSVQIQIIAQDLQKCRAAGQRQRVRLSVH